MNSSKKKILIVDDSELNRALLSDILEEDFDIVEACNGMEAMAYLHENGVEVALMLLDIVMPEMDGFEVLAMMNKNGWIKTIPVIMISAESGGAYIDRAYDLGAIDYINRPFDERTVKHRVACNFMLALKQKEVQDMLSNQIYEKEKDNNLMIEILSNIVEFRNGESGLHVLHVHTITEKILKQLVKKTDKYPLTTKDIRLISTASALHDIGKISIPSEILNKPGRLTPEEYDIMKCHTIEGAKMLDNLVTRKEEALVRISYQICRWHHERYDGRGYPDGIKGDDIPISAQVVALADVYDALVSKRVYKPPIQPEKAVQMILNNECGVFNPLLTECLVEIAPELQKELDVVSYGNSTENDISDSVQQLFKTDGTDMSRRMVRQIEHERLKYKHLADISHEITFEYVVSPEMIKLSDWSADSLGLPADILNPLENEKWCKIFPREDFTKFLDAIRATSPGDEVIAQQYLLNTGSGDKWNKVIAKAMWIEEDKPELEGAICKIIDINDTTITMKQLERRAEHDAATGLLNRETAKKRIQAMLTVDDTTKYALLFFDIDDFKQANDKYGHLFGDKVIEEVAARIKANTRSTDITARFGGDEFLIFMECGGSLDHQVDRIYKKLVGAYKEFDIRVSMGVATNEGGIKDCEQLINMADVALYTVKNNSKRSYKFYDDSMKPMMKTAQDLYNNGKIEGDNNK